MTAAVAATDPDGDSLTYRWQVMEESSATQTGGDLESVPEEIEGVFDDAGGAEVSLRTPETPGAYRLFVYVEDGEGHAAHANLPFYVE